MKIALIGNPNSGKTTLFNILTGSNAKIGNWPGVTIEKREGVILGTNFKIIDLPGIYSLSPYSIEENISTEFLLNENPDIIINIVDATCLERSLYLTTQLLELDCKVIVVLNMVDLLEKKGIFINTQKLEMELGTKVCKISALKQIGIIELINSIKNLQQKKKLFIFSSRMEKSILEIEKVLNKKNKRFLSIKFLEEDERFKKNSSLQINQFIQETKNEYNLDLEEEIATERYIFISKLKKKICVQKAKKINTTEILDKIFLNKFISIPIFICIMFAIYFLSVGVVGNYIGNLMKIGINSVELSFQNYLSHIHISKWLISLINNGIITGVGTVICFVPQLTSLFLCISILESTGYMPRIAFLLDRLFRKIGLNGKALIPFIIGSGCSVPGIMATRIIDNHKERKMVCSLVPFIPCSAKIPIIALFAGYFFEDKSGLFSGVIYILSIIIIIITSFMMKKYIFKNTNCNFISELPDYKIPNIKLIIKDVVSKVTGFVTKASTTILFCSVIEWFLLNFSPEFKYGMDIENSILALIGKKISWIFYPIVGTYSWEVAVSSLQGLIAKEQVVSSLSIIAGKKEMFGESGAFAFFNQISSSAYIIFNLFSAPCINAILALNKELKSIKSTVKVIFFQTIFAWSIASIVYFVGSLFIK